MDRGAWRGYSPRGRKELDMIEQLTRVTFCAGCITKSHSPDSVSPDKIKFIF